jgi:hypothetical protein
MRCMLCLSTLPLDSKLPEQLYSSTATACVAGGSASCAAGATSGGNSDRSAF